MNALAGRVAGRDGWPASATSSPVDPHKTEPDNDGRPEHHTHRPRTCHVTATAQHMHALKLANETRAAIRHIKDELRAMPRDQAAVHLAAMLLSDPHDDAFEAAPLWGLLTSIRRVGDLKARNVMRAADVSAPDRRVRDLTVRQRAVVAETMTDWAAMTVLYSRRSQRGDTK